MRFFVGKTVNLVFDGWAIAWAHAFYLACKHWAAVKTAAYDVMGGAVGMGNPARHLARMQITRAAHRKHRRRRVTWLLTQSRKINAAAINAWRCTRFQTPLWQLQFAQFLAQAHGRRVTRTPALVVFQADVDFARQKRPCRQHHRTGIELQTHGREHTADALTVQNHIVHLLLEQIQIVLVFQHVAYRCLIQHTVGLCTRGTHRRAFRRV